MQEPSQIFVRAKKTGNPQQGVVIVPELKVGVVGCGSFGRNAYVRNILSYPGATVSAVCDTVAGRLDQLIDTYFSGDDAPAPPTLCNDHRMLLEGEDVDVVMVGTMADVRPAVSIEAMNGGRHVLAAKPMAPSLPEAEAMIAAAQKADRLFMVGYNFRFREDAQAMRRFIADGGIGQPMFARAWSHEASVPTWGPHYIKAQSGGGSLASTAVHVIDMAVWFLGSPSLDSVTGSVHSRFHELPSFPENLEAVRSTYDTEDLVSAHVAFQSGQSMTIEGMWLAPGEMNRKGVDVWGSEGVATLDPFRLLSWENGDYVDKTGTFIFDAGETQNSSSRTTKEVHHFLDCCLGKAQPLITMEEMWTDQAIVDGIYGTSS